MAQPVRIAFRRQVLMLALSNILPTRRLEPGIRRMSRYKRIAASIAEVGIVEPLVVAKGKDEAEPYMLVDGHLRHAALLDLGVTEAPCVIADDDEAFTYNKRVNRLATVQEHYMIARAVERGVSEEKLARALNVDIQMIKLKRGLLNGICPEVIERLKDRSIDASVFGSLRKMTPLRQIEVVDLMAAVGNFTSRYAQALMAATRQQDLARPEREKKIKGLTSEQMARMEREMEGLQRDIKSVEASYGDAVLDLVIASGYVAKLLGDAGTHLYLARHHPEILTEFQAIVTAASLDDAAPAN
jgi:RepB plasmid partitioning protein/ParB-like nuclease domain